MVRSSFHKTLVDLQIKGTDLAAASGLTSAQISSFCSGRGVRLSTFVTLLDGLEQVHPGARLHFCRLLAGEEFQPVVSPPCTMACMQEFIDGLKLQDLSYVLHLTSNRFVTLTRHKPKGKARRFQAEAQLKAAQSLRPIVLSHSVTTEGKPEGTAVPD